MDHVVIVDDEAAIADTLVYALEAERFSTRWFSLAGPALDYLRANPADLVVLDIGLPDMSGFDACRALRRFSDVPVLFLTARGAEIDRVVGLEIGGDDYVVKPFSPREVAARIRTILKRAGPRRAENEASTTHEPSAIRIDDERLQVHYRGRLLRLTPHEFHVLRCLLTRPQRVFSRQQLLEAVGVAEHAGYERTIDSHVKSLRAKLREVAPEAEPIQTHRGFGYSYDPERA